ncbi:RNA-binding protein [Candidatus Woesearchaeota archaeon]|nr:MAG: RNA-binding protein [Candidatus Woesearchaeota archaeon]
MTEKSELLARDKEVVVPGQVLATGMEFLPSSGTYRKGDRIYANQTGLLVVEGKVLKTIPMAGAYLPKRYDVIIGKVIDILMTGWRLETNSPYSAVLPLKDATFDYIKKGADLTEFFNLDEYVVCKIMQVTSQNLVDVSMKGPGLRKLKGGRIIKVSPPKVPRIIGKRGSMVALIKQATGCQMCVGQNGLIWLSGEPEQEVLAVKTIRKIEREAHVPGLTERIKSFLEKATGKKLEIGTDEEYERQHESRRPQSRPREGRGHREESGGARRGRRPPRR